MCFKCLATCGHHDFSLVYTDCSRQAGWHQTQDVRLPYTARPPLCDLVGDNLSLVYIDIMHAWNLGVLRDLLGTVLKLLLRKRGFYRGRNLQKRLAVFNKDLRNYVRDNKLELSARKIKKETLNWKSDVCPILFAKAADCATILQYVNYKLQEHFEVSDYPSLVA